MKAAWYRYALSNMIGAAVRNAASINAKQEATKLLAAREDAIRSLYEIDERLREELERAKRANRDADTFALIATLAGAGASYLSTTKDGADTKDKDVSTTTTTQRKSTPSGAVLQLIETRVEAEGRVMHSDIEAGAFLQKDGKTVYVPFNMEPLR
jgi:hypothetical protein